MQCLQFSSHRDSLTLIFIYLYFFMPVKTTSAQSLLWFLKETEVLQHTSWRSTTLSGQGSTDNTWAVVS